MALTSYWKLNGNSTDIIRSENGTDTAITYSQANGVLNSGAGFNGSSSKFYRGPATFPYTTDYTVSTWSRRGTNGGNILNIGGAFWCLWIAHRSDYLRHGIATTQDAGYYCDSTDSVYLNSTKWMNIVAVRRGLTVLELWADGKYLNQASTTTYGLRTTNTNLEVGYFAYSATKFYFDGAIDEIKFDNTPWTAAKIKNEYSRVKGFF